MIVAVSADVYVCARSGGDRGAAPRARAVLPHGRAPRRGRDVGLIPRVLRAARGGGPGWRRVLHAQRRAQALGMTSF
jgi:hypothetical protein